MASYGVAAWLVVAAVLDAVHAGRARLALDNGLAYGRPIAGRLDAAIGPMAELYRALNTHTPPEAVIVEPLLFESPDPAHQMALALGLGLRRFALPREVVLIKFADWRAAARDASTKAPVFVLDVLHIVEPADDLEGVVTSSGFTLWRYTQAPASDRDG